MNNVEVKEIRKIEVVINMTPDQWDPNNKSADTTRWHKARLLNQRVAKYAPTLGVVDFYMNIARFAHELGFGDNDVIIQLTEYLYGTKLEFYDVNDAATSTG